MGAADDTPGLLAFAFPGQGAQFAGMGSGLAVASDAARETLWQACDHLGYDLPAVMADAGRIDDLEVAGIATLACSVAATRAAESLGVRAGIVLGHSLGEYAAMVAAGALSFENALDLVALRARVTAKAAAAAPGAMSALIGIGWEQARELCKGAGEVWIANDNHPGQVVASGRIEALERLEKEAAARGVRVQRLAVAGAFHCPLMAPAAEQMESALAEVPFGRPSCLLVSSTSARCEDEPAQIRQVLVDQLTGPVRFTETIALAWELGARRILECGAKPVLAGLVRRMPQEWSIASASDRGLPAPAPLGA